MATYSFTYNETLTSFVAPKRFTTADAVSFINKKYGKVSNLKKVISL